MSIGKLTREGLPFSNVVASGVATAQISPGRLLERLTFAMGGTTFNETHISNIKMKANGKAFVDIGGADLKKLMAFRGQSPSSGYLTLDFTEGKGRDYLDQMIGGFDMSRGIENVTAEVTIAGATAPTLKWYLTESAPQVIRDGSRAPWADLMSKILKYPFSTSTGGVLPVNLPFGQTNGAVIKRIHVAQATGNVTAATVKADGMEVFGLTSGVNSADLADHGKTAQANWFSIDFIRDGNQKNALDTRDLKSLELLLNLYAADSGNVYVEYYDTLGNL